MDRKTDLSEAEHRAQMVSRLNRVIDALQLWERHLRNPTRYTRPLRGISPTIERLGRLAADLDLYDQKHGDNAQ